MNNKATRTLNPLRTSVFGASASIVLTLTTAQAAPVNYDGVDALSLQNFIATVSMKVVTGDEVTVDIQTGEDASYEINVSLDNGIVRIEGPERPRNLNLYNKGWRHKKVDAFTEYLKDYPTITINVPQGLTIQTVDGIASLDIGDTNGDMTVTNMTYVRGTIGDIKTGNIELAGSGTLDVGTVSQDLKAALRGSGDLSFAKAQNTSLSLKGSGDLEIGDINGTLTADMGGSGDISIQNVAGKTDLTLKGSGDLEIGNIDGATTIKLDGSGDIQTGDILGGVEASVRGSGNIDIDSMQGILDVHVTGSGEIDIDGGSASKMIAKVSGSGEIHFSGTAKDPELTANSSGDITLGSYTGNLVTKGRGDIRVDGKNYSDRK